MTTFDMAHILGVALDSRVKPTGRPLVGRVMLSEMPEFIPLLMPPADLTAHRYFYVVEAKIWECPEPADEQWGMHFLGVLDGVACWGVDVPSGIDPADGAAIDLRMLYGRASEVEWSIAGRALQLVEWARTHRFCGRCASPTELAPGERAMRCPSCGMLSYPRLAPAIITLVTRGSDEVLLGRGVQFPLPMYSCLAGFVEPGETLEQAVAREVFEEVGVRLRDIRYWGSQPWPFPHSLMLGFRAEWASGDIVIDPTEIVDANWYHRDDLPMIPPGISIARRLIDAWLAE